MNKIIKGNKILTKCSDCIGFCNFGTYPKCKNTNRQILSEMGGQSER